MRAMTVRDLIIILQALPQDLPVFRDDFEWGPSIRVSNVYVGDTHANYFTREDPAPEKAVVIR